MVKHHRVCTILRSTSIFVAFAMLASVAQPDDIFRPTLKFCNRTLSKVNVAVSYDLAGTAQSTSVGWYAVQGCTCRTVLQSTPLRATEIFLFAHRSAGAPNLLQPAKANTCVKSDAFKMMPENANARTCSAAGGSWLPFKLYDTVGRPYTVNLRQPGQCNLMGDQ